MREFIKTFLIFCIILGGVVFIYNRSVPEKFRVEDIWFAYFFLVAATSLTHYYLTKAGKKSPTHFVGSFFAMTACKLFVYLIVIVIYCLLKPKLAMGFSVGFLSMYFLFSAFEVFALLKHFRK